jgi:leader peptidase (prepilin peptidase)/N-methyltransferase
MEDILSLILIFILGLLMGSFLNCVAYRIFKEEDFVSKRSYCPKCKKTLGVFDLIPVLSYIFLIGKCRYCKDRISLQYPLTEIFTGLIFAGAFLYSPTPLFLAFNLLMFSFSILLFLSDLRYMLISDAVIFPAIALPFVFNIVLDLVNGNNLLELGSYSLNGGLGALITGGFFGLIVLISREKWMGKGDIFLGLMVGFFLGWTNTILAMFLSFFIGSIISLILVSLKKKGLKSEVPFGPFLLVGTWIAFFWGDKIVSWYLNLFLL